jgi:NAD(P)-dependent dehydrogenase (short-subunit alcohol dehydrogenase family)
MTPSRVLLRALPLASRAIRQQRPAFVACGRNAAQTFSTTIPRCQAGGPPKPPAGDSAGQPFLGTQKRLPEFDLSNKVVLVSGAARGLGLVQAEALLEAGAIGMPIPRKILEPCQTDQSCIVYALDRLPEPSPYFHTVAERAKELGTSLEYRQIDVRDVEGLNKIVGEIGSKHGRLDGLIAAAGIQQETSALEYTAEDANTMFAVNITGVFMTAQAAAKQMIKFGNGGSILMIASMSATVANKVI